MKITLEILKMNTSVVFTQHNHLKIDIKSDMWYNIHIHSNH